MRSLRLSILVLASCSLASCAELGQRLVDRITIDRPDAGDDTAPADAGHADATPKDTSGTGPSAVGTVANPHEPRTGRNPAIPDLAATADSAAASPDSVDAEDPELRRLYDEGLAAQKAGLYDVALDSWERVWAQAPDFEDVSDLLLKEYLVRGLELFAAGSLDRAISSWEMARRIRPESPRVEAYLARAREQRERATPLE